MFSFSLNSFFFTANEFSVICKFTKSDFGFLFHFFVCFKIFKQGQLKLYRLNQLILHNLEGKYILMRLCVSDWMGRKSSKKFGEKFFEPIFFIRLKQVSTQNFFAASLLVLNILKVVYDLFSIQPCSFCSFLSFKFSSFFFK